MQDVLDASEAHATLVEMVGKRAKPIPAHLLADHIIVVTDGGDWPVQRAAMEALMRRLSSARTEQLTVAKRPNGRRILGDYTTKTPGRGGHRPYRTLLRALAPFEGCCDCPDFLRSSLALCKHLLAVLLDLYEHPKRLVRGLKESRLDLDVPLSWNPVRPLNGAGDWLDRVRWEGSRPPARTVDAALAPFAGKGLEPPGQRRGRVQALQRALGRGTVVDPALVALLATERDALERRQHLAKVGATKARPKGLLRKLYPYQQEGIARFLQTGRLLLGDDMGLGKTTQAVAACHTLFQHGLVRRGLIIAPAALKWQWLREWEAVTKVPATIVDGPPSTRRELYQQDAPGFLILNYELLLRDLPDLRAMDAHMVVLDEAQRIKNWATKTARAVKSLPVPYRLVLTGTPMENRLEELASIYDWVDDRAIEPKWRLLAWHGLHAQEGGRGELVGARNLDTLRERMAPTFLRRVREEVLSQLPPRTETTIPVPMDPEQAAAHAELDQPIARLLATARRRALRQEEFLRLMSLLTTQRIICNGMAQHDFEYLWPSLEVLPPSHLSGPGRAQIHRLASPKLVELRALVEDLVIEQQRKVIIFSQWRRMLKLAHWAISDRLDATGQRAVFFTGAESQKQRTAGVVALHDDPDTRVMFLSDAGGVGLNLQRAASVCINLELPWNPAVLEQRIGRVYRLGQTSPVNVFNLVSQCGIEARIANIVSSKRELFEGLFDGTTDQIVFSSAGSAMAQIQRLAPAVDEATEPAGHANDDVPDDLPPPPEMAEVAAVADEAALRDSLPTTTTPDVRRMLSSLEIRPTDNGGVVIEAPPEAARTLAGLFGAMAKLLEAHATEDPSRGSDPDHPSP